MRVKDEYPYLYETHLHTSEGSACSISTGGEMALACKEAGYTGIFVTNHNWGGNTCVDRKLPFPEWVRRFAAGYEEAKAVGEAIGLDVFFGWESGYQGTEFLIYGFEPKWLLAHPQIWTATVEEQYKMVKADGGMVIHAHPYRTASYIKEIRLFPEYVDGVEAINATHNADPDDSHYMPWANDSAFEYAKQHNFPVTAGSDVHNTTMIGGGMMLKRKLKDSADFIKMVMAGEDYVLTDGKVCYRKDGAYIECFRSRKSLTRST